MKQINEILKKYEIKPHRYTTTGKATIVDTQMGRFVVKKNIKDKKIFDYLKSRSFDYYPKTVNEEDEDYDIIEYIEDTDYPNDKKCWI